MEQKFRAKVKESQKERNYKDVSNREGWSTKINKYGNVMFYPDGGEPYCICLGKEDVEFI